MDNQTVNMDLLQLEGLKVTSSSSIPTFVLLLLIYIFIVVSNFGLLLLVFTDRSLQQPMYLLLCNMSVNDVFGATVMVPHILRDLLTLNSYISYLECVIQAFCVHLHASAVHTVLMIMAFDRYVAICNPLRYATIMTSRMVAMLSAAAWGTVFVLVVILLGLSVRLSRCRTVISGLFCNNASLFKLSCESVLINNIYGLGYTVLLLGSSLGSVALTYLRIAIVCLSSKNKTLNSKALQTCATHLVVYIIMFTSGSIVISLHRFPHLSDYRKMLAMLCHVVSPAINIIIYGLHMKVIRQRVFLLFTRKTLTVNVNC